VGGSPQRIAVVASASANGKTTLALRLASALDAPFTELDALVHGPGWTETPDAELMAVVGPLVAAERWVIDGTYVHKLGTLVLDAADLVVWLDLPTRVWLPRLLRRTVRRVRGGEELWNGNRETWGSLWGRDGLVVWGLRSQRQRRRAWPQLLAGRELVRLRTPREVDDFARAFERSV
jgi:hypothetical protein